VRFRSVTIGTNNDRQRSNQMNRMRWPDLATFEVPPSQHTLCTTHRNDRVALKTIGPSYSHDTRLEDAEQVTMTCHDGRLSTLQVSLTTPSSTCLTRAAGHPHAGCQPSQFQLLERSLHRQSPRRTHRTLSDEAWRASRHDGIAWTARRSVPDGQAGNNIAMVSVTAG
jgi:hypothetical protein